MNLLYRHLLTAALLAGSAVVAAELPAPTLTKATSVAKRPDPDGFIQRWLLLEPIPAIGLTDSAVQAIVKKEYFPNQLTVVPRDGDKVTAGGEQLTWHAVDTRNYNVNLYHFAWERDKKTTNQLFWAQTTIHCPREMSNVRLAIGSNAATVWWVNGTEVIGIYNDRQTVIDDGVSRRLTLKQGTNVVRAAIVNGGGATAFRAGFLDKDDRAVTGFTINAGEVRKVRLTWARPLGVTTLDLITFPSRTPRPQACAARKSKRPVP